MKPSLRRSTAALLASSLLLTIGRGATLPFMTIYLTRVFNMSVENIGYALTIALTVGVVFSMGFGILADKFDKKRYMLISIVAFIAGFVAIPLVDNVTLVVLFFSLINCAYSVFSTVLKAWFADVLTSSQKARVFSLNYSFLNIGWTIGPPVGTLLVMYSLQLPFWLAAFCAALPLGFIHFFVQKALRSMPPKRKCRGNRQYCLKTARSSGTPFPACWRRMWAGHSPAVFRSTCWLRMPTATLRKTWSLWCCR